MLHLDLIDSHYLPQTAILVLLEAIDALNLQIDLKKIFHLLEKIVILTETNK